MEDKTTGVLIRFPADLLKDVEEYRHAKRISSRHQAILDLIEKAIKQEATK